MCQLPGYADLNYPHWVCHLRKTLYGLKQSGCRWYQQLVEILVTKLGFKQCEVDQAVFIKQEGMSLMIIVVHVDDCTITATTLTLITAIKCELSRFVEVTDLGELHWLLGIEVTQNREECTLALLQQTYIDAILHHFNFNELKPISMPMEPSMKLSTSQLLSTTAEYAAMQNILYQKAVGSLMYAVPRTWPDILYAVSQVSHFSSNHGQVHWDTIWQIYRHLLGMKNLQLIYGGGEKELARYTDTDGSVMEDHCAISGYAFLIDGGAISWSSKHQEIVSLSMTESEYVGVTHATKEALWLCMLTSSLFTPLLQPTTLFSDNQSAIALVKDHQYHTCTKHIIDVHFHFIRWIIDDSKIQLIYCPTGDMVTNIFTKALPLLKVKHFTVELGLHTAWGGVSEWASVRAANHVLTCYASVP